MESDRTLSDIMNYEEYWVKFPPNNFAIKTNSH